MSFFFFTSGTTYPDARGRNSDTHHRMGVIWTLVVHCTKDLCDEMYCSGYFGENKVCHRAYL